MRLLSEKHWIGRGRTKTAGCLWCRMPLLVRECCSPWFGNYRASTQPRREVCKCLSNPPWIEGFGALLQLLSTDEARASQRHTLSFQTFLVRMSFRAASSHERCQSALPLSQIAGERTMSARTNLLGPRCLSTLVQLFHILEAYQSKSFSFSAWLMIIPLWSFSKILPCRITLDLQLMTQGPIFLWLYHYRPCFPLHFPKAKFRPLLCQQWGLSLSLYSLCYLNL